MESQEQNKSDRTAENKSAFVNPPATQIVSRFENQENDSEAATLLEVFPNEIWLHILGRIGKPGDLSSLGNSSRFFGELVKLLKTKILFPEVIKIIVANLQGTAKEVRQILLNCRLVCQYWELGIDLVLCSFSTNCELVNSYRFYSPGREPFKGITTTFIRREDTLAFLQHFDEAYASKNRTPFLSGIVDIKYYNRENRNSFTLLLLEILRMYGRHVLKFNIFYVASSAGLPAEDAILCYERLRDMLYLMPNLKELRIGPHFAGITKEGFEALQLYMKSCVFPELISLQRLELVELPASVSDAILRSCSHVTILKVDHGFTNINHWLYPIQMPNLTQLALVLPNNESLIQLETANVTWSLTSLELQVGPTNFDWEKLFKILQNRWAATLTKLKLVNFSLYNNPAMKVLPCLELPNLKMFLICSFYFISMDFLLPTSNSLEHLQVSNALPPVQNHDFILNENIVKMYSFRRNLTESNIWTLFPKLKNCSYYDRHVGYNQVSNRRLRVSKNRIVNSFTVQHGRVGRN